MKYRLEKIQADVIFTLEGAAYTLRSHPYEPCLYIYKNDEMIKILHNAFEVDDLVGTFEAGGTVKGPDGRCHDLASFCRVLAAAISDSRYEMNWTFAARLAESSGLD